jgi:Tfp pilus assembly protein PilW
MSPIGRQAGATLLETMIALALSALVTTAMVILMANSLGTATRVIHMSQLTDELRNAMSMMTRDVRRANYSANAIFCYGNSQCGASGGVAEQVGDVQVADNGQCFTFTLDRNSDGNAANDSVSGFRRVVTSDVGIIEMWTGAAGTAPDCTSGAGADGWIEVTDPRTVNVTWFDVNDGASFTQDIEESETSTFTNRQRQIQITLEGQLVLEEARNEVVVSREIGDIIYVRNDYIVL